MQTQLETALTEIIGTKVGTTSSSPYSGSPSFDEIPFHLDAGRQPPLGAWVVVECGSPDFVHYGRIVGGREENPRADPARLQQNQAYQVGERQPRPSDSAPHVTRVVQAELLGEIRLDNGRMVVTEPRSLPQTGRSVYTLRAAAVPQLLGVPTDPAIGIDLGNIESGGETSPLLLPVAVLPRHIGIYGKPGTGKSYAAGVIVEELVRLGIPVVSFDVLGDLFLATDELRGMNLEAGTDDFRVPWPIIGLGEFLAFIPNLTRDQTEIVSAAYDTLYDQAIDQLRTTGEVDIPIERLLDEIRDVGGATGQAPVADRAVRRVRAAYNRSGLLTTRTQPWLERLADRPILNIYVGHLPQRQRNLAVGASVRMLQILRRRDHIPPFALLLDEAHLFLPGGGHETPSTIVIRELVRTARHDAIAVVLVTQSPGSMDRQSFIICNTRLVFALDREDLSLVGGHLSDLPELVVDRIPKLPTGTAVVTSGVDLIRHSVLVRIRRRRTSEGAPTPNLAEEVLRWRERNEIAIPN